MDRIHSSQLFGPNITAVDRCVDWVSMAAVTLSGGCVVRLGEDAQEGFGIEWDKAMSSN